MFWVLDRVYFEREFRACPGGGAADPSGAPLRALWTRTSPPYALCVPLDGSMLSLNIRVTGRWQDCAELADWADRACDAGDLLVDVGAAYGFCSLLFAARGFRVVALDANPWHAALVRGSAELNGVKVSGTVVCVEAEIDGVKAGGTMVDGVEVGSTEMAGVGVGGADREKNTAAGELAAAPASDPLEGCSAPGQSVDRSSERRAASSALRICSPSRLDLLSVLA